jgi:sugar phosphate isomerase/epimerase
MEIALQMFTLREELKKDFIGTLKSVSQIGYRNIELAGGGWGYSAKELIAILDDLGLKAVSNHGSFELMDRNLEGQIEFTKELGIPVLVFPYLNREEYSSEIGVLNRIDKLRKMGEVCKVNGIRLAYHNHDFELANIGEKTILDTIFEEIDSSLIEPEFDLYWLKKAGKNPMEYLRNYSGKMHLIHIKDMDPMDGSFAEVGQGNMNYPEILCAAQKAGVQYGIVEQDVCKRSPIESIQISFDYLKEIGYAH